MKTLICSLSGVRGVTGDDLTPAVALGTTHLFNKIYVLRNKKSAGTGGIVIGKDPKASGIPLIRGALAGLANSTKVYYLGTTATPAIEWAVSKFKADGGIMITASHNPKQWNGIKLISGCGKKPPALLDSAIMREICDRLTQSIPAQVPPVKIPSVKAYRRDYYNDILTKTAEIIDACSDKKGTGRAVLAKIKEKNFKFVLDACCAEGAILPGGLLAALGIKEKNVIVINSGKIENSDRPLEPAAENLENLRNAIKKSGADAGFALDPDQDRLVTMPLLTEENTPLLAAKFLFELQKNRKNKAIKSVVINSSTSAAWEDVGAKYGIKIIRVPVGEANVAAEMIKRKIIFGAEGNGGVILGSVNYGRNSAAGIALTVSYLAWSGKTLSELNGELPRFYMTKNKIPVSGMNPGEIINKIVRHYTNRASVAKIENYDGCKISFKDDSWLQIRASNTEPIVRIFAESRASAEKAEKIFENAKRIFKP